MSNINQEMLLRHIDSKVCPFCRSEDYAVEIDEEEECISWECGDCGRDADASGY